MDLWSQILTYCILALAKLHYKYIISGYKARWTSFHPEQWTPTDVGEWIEYTCLHHFIPRTIITDVKESFISVNGRNLITMTMEDFQIKSTKLGGMLCEAFRDMCSGGKFMCVVSLSLYEIQCSRQQCLEWWQPNLERRRKDKRKRKEPKPYTEQGKGNT